MHQYSQCDGNVPKDMLGGLKASLLLILQRILECFGWNVGVAA